MAAATGILDAVDLREPLRSVIPGVQGAVLAVLAGALRPLTGADVARLVEGEASYRGVLYALDRLVAHGLVDREDHPPLALFRLNRDHLAAMPILALADLRGQLIERLTAYVDRWEVQPTAVWLFGSFARGEGGADSDLDVVVVRPDVADLDEPIWDEQVADLGPTLHRWTGNPGSVIEYGIEELRAGALERSSVVESLLHDARRIVGPTPLEVLAPSGATG